MKSKTISELKVIINTTKIQEYRKLAEVELERRRPESPEIDMLALLIGTESN
jgi:hypothetical protein